jgi:hypothetical protein
LKTSNRILSILLAVILVINAAFLAYAQDDNPASLGYSATEENDRFFLDCTPEQAAELIAFYELAKTQISRQSNLRLLRSAPGDSGTVSWAWGEAVGIDVPSGDPDNPYHIGNIPRITLGNQRRMVGFEGLILQGCDGDIDEWVEGINEMLTEAEILKDDSIFKDKSVFEYKGLIDQLSYHVQV